MSGDITRSRSTHVGRHRQSASVTTKRSANSLTRSSTLGASVWAPTVGFATLGMATVAAITLVGLEQGADHVHGTPAADAAAAKPPAVTSVAPAKAATHKGHDESLPTKPVSYATVVPDATAQVKARPAEVIVATRRVAKVVTQNAAKKTNVAPSHAPKGGSATVSRPASGTQSGSGSTSGGSTGTPSQGSGSGSGVGLNTPVLDVKVGAGSGDLLGTGLQVGL